MSGPVVLAGGGTGGHVFVARAVAEALGAKGLRPAEIRFVGSHRGQERDLLADTGIELTLLPGRGLLRSMAPRAIVQNLGSLGELTWAVLRSLGLVRRWKPRAVVSVGGYAAAPMGIAAVVLGRPLILVNVDAAPGLTHRLLGRFATASCVPVAGTGLPNEVVVGIPVRSVFSGPTTEETRAAARAALNIPEDATVLGVTTGSLGARSVNQAVLGLGDVAALSELTILHIAGRRDFDAVADAHTASGRAHSVVVPFCEDMASFYAASDLAVTRAGALSVGELCVTGTPAILVPLPGAPGDHQTLNARMLSDAGAGVVLADAELSPERLAELVVSLLADRPRLASMRAAARALAHHDAAGEVAEVVMAHAR